MLKMNQGHTVVVAVGWGGGGVGGGDNSLASGGNFFLNFLKFVSDFKKN